MQKQLNPMLFGMQTSPRGHMQEHSENEVALQTDALDRSELGHSIQLLDDKIEKAIRLFQEFQTQTTQSAFQLEESVKALRVKSERQQTILNKFEYDQEALTIETSQKLHFLQQKHAEQKNLENSVQNLVDRQNNLLKGFEVRLGQLQKLLADKEMQVVSTLAALNDAKAELQRLKRQ